MTLGEVASDTKYHFMRAAVVVGVVASLLGLIIVGVTIGIEAARIRPHISRVDVIGPTSIPAGSHLTVQLHDNIPAACIGRTRREIDIDPPLGWNPKLPPPADMLPGDSMPDNRPNIIPVPLGTGIGCGSLVITRDMSGCGAFSGVLTGRPAIGSTDSAGKPVKVCVTPAVVPPPVKP